MSALCEVCGLAPAEYSCEATDASAATVRCAVCVRSTCGATWPLDSKSFYVKRTRDARIGWTGSIRPLAQAMREAAAWRVAGWEAQVLPNTREVRRDARLWSQLAQERRMREAGRL